MGMLGMLNVGKPAGTDANEGALVAVGGFSGDGAVGAGVAAVVDASVLVLRDWKNLNKDMVPGAVNMQKYAEVCKTRMDDNLIVTSLITRMKWQNQSGQIGVIRKRLPYRNQIDVNVNLR